MAGLSVNPPRSSVDPSGFENDFFNKLIVVLKECETGPSPGSPADRIRTGSSGFNWCEICCHVGTGGIDGRPGILLGTENAVFNFKSESSEMASGTMRKLAVWIIKSLSFVFSTVVSGLVIEPS